MIKQKRKQKYTNKEANNETMKAKQEVQHYECVYISSQ